MSDNLLSLQRKAFSYFVHETNPANGLVRDKTADDWDWPASIAATGLALAAYPVGVERGFLTRAAALERTLATLRFFAASPHGPEPDATGYKGFYYHFVDIKSGRRAWQCELSTVDTALLLAGVLTAAAYFDASSADESELRSLADALYTRVDWTWAQNGGATVTHGWKPESGFLHYRWEGYDEALILYLLGLGSPTHPLSPDSYAAWASTYEWKTLYDIEFLYAGLQLTHQLSHVCRSGMSTLSCAIARSTTREQPPRHLRPALRDRESARSCSTTKPAGDHGQDDQGIHRRFHGVERQFYDHWRAACRMAPTTALAPWAVWPPCCSPRDRRPRSSTSQAELDEVHPYDSKPPSIRPSGSLGPSARVGVAVPHGINEGPIVTMIENHLTGFVWQLMRKCPYIVTGLRRAGFSGGWLADAP
jgi:hypothetical protein